MCSQSLDTVQMKLNKLTSNIFKAIIKENKTTVALVLPKENQIENYEDLKFWNINIDLNFRTIRCFFNDYA